MWWGVTLQLHYERLWHQSCQKKKDSSAGFAEASGHVQKAHVVKNWRWPSSNKQTETEGGFLPVSQEETEAFSPIGHKELNPANNHVSLEAVFLQ